MENDKNAMAIQSGKFQCGENQPAQNTTGLRLNMTCPRCHAAKLDYNGLLHLVCLNCSLQEVGAST